MSDARFIAALPSTKSIMRFIVTPQLRARTSVSEMFRKYHRALDEGSYPVSPRLLSPLNRPVERDRAVLVSVVAQSAGGGVSERGGATGAADGSPAHHDSRRPRAAARRSLGTSAAEHSER